MIATLKICRFCVWGSLLLTGQQVQGQVVQSATVDHTPTNRLTPAMKYFGRGMRMPAGPSQARHQAPPTRRLPLAGGKPFQKIYRRPTISPYLSLDMVESSVGLPNYYLRVLPQMEQQQANQAQAAELRRLQQQIRLASAPGTTFNNRIGNNRNGGVPTTGYSTQFMNNGGYFPSIGR